MTEDGVTIAAHYDMKTSFLGVIGMNTLPANAFSEVHLPDPIIIEIAMVLDYSGSMNDNGKYVRMTAAAQQFIQKVSNGPRRPHQDRHRAVLGICARDASRRDDTRHARRRMPTRR